MGMSTALLGKEAAMACTEAVEDVISEHYNDQLRELMEEHPEDTELRDVFRFLMLRLIDSRLSVSLEMTNKSINTQP